MSDCCSSSQCETAQTKKRCCPINEIECVEVSVRTITHHIKQPWLWNDRGHRYFFCDDPACDVVYFGADDSLLLKSQLRTGVGIKDNSDNAMLCYCFGVSRTDAIADPSIKDFVIAQTKKGLCSCETSNPSGRCCLKDFPLRIEIV
jgi:hypothetical protein